MVKRPKLFYKIIVKNLRYLNFAKVIEARIISEFLDLKEGECVCDIACGTGEHSVKMAKRGCKVYGIDLNSSSIESAKIITDGFDCHFQVGNAEKLPYNSDMFDKVISVCALEHFQNDENAIKEINRILKPKGILVLTVDSFTYKDVKKNIQEMHKKDYNVVNYYSESHLAQKLERSGFKVLKSRYFINSPLSSYFFSLGIRIKPVYIVWAISPIALFLSLLSDYLLAQKNEGYLLAIKAQKV